MKKSIEITQLEELFASQGFITQLVIVEDDVKTFTRLDVSKESEKVGAFFFISGRMASMDEVNRLQNK